MNYLFEPDFSMPNMLMWSGAVYEFSRLAYQDVDGENDPGLKLALQNH